LVAALLMTGCSELAQRATQMRERDAIFVIRNIHSAETEYYRRTGHYGSLSDIDGLLDHSLATGEKGGFRFTVALAPSGYEIKALPVQAGAAAHSFSSDQSMVIRQR
jgi:hypothetical protein